MAKKSNDVFFNLFNAESDFDQETINSENSQIELNAQLETDTDNEKENTPAQTTMFDNENFAGLFDASSALTEDKSSEPAAELADADEPETLVENNDETPIDNVEEETFDEIIENTSIEVDTAETVDLQNSAKDTQYINPQSNEIPGFFIENNVYNDVPQNLEEEKIVSMLESNPLDEEYASEQIEYDLDEVTEDIFTNIKTYNEIKDQKSFDSFETPYLFRGKDSERVRYRLYIPSKKKPKLNRFKKSFMSWFITIAAAIIIALLLRTFVFVIATVEGPSMLPTLKENEKLFVTKYTYKFSEIQRGDIVICKYNTATYRDVYVKRVIATGGETISIVDGAVYINGEEIQEDYVSELCDNDMEPVTVPEGEVFVMGDNRNISADSRKIGSIKEDFIIGKVQFRVFPLDKFGAVEGKQ